MDTGTEQLEQTEKMRHFSTLAGPLLPAPAGGGVRFRSLRSYDKFFYRLWTMLLAYGSMALVIAYAVILFQPAHWAIRRHPHMHLVGASWLMLGCLGLLQLFLAISTFSSIRSILRARNPLPVEPPAGLKVAFATTRAPAEPIDMVAKTLRAARAVRYDGGSVDVWLLDETNDSELQALCADLGVYYFSREGIEKWNTAPGPSRSRRALRTLMHLLTFGIINRLPKTSFDATFAARSKHGNFNAWGEFLDGHETTYDIIAAVDTDQVPEPNFLERLLGYFRDPDVAYAVGPQAYGNYGPGLQRLVARWAEAQSSFFHSTTQRAGNATASCMFVGTNYAVRTSVLAQIRGFRPYITEDLATGLAIHSQRNPVTGKHWKSVYTPDLLAVGEGPSYWSPFFNQQWRWAAGAFDTWKRMIWRIFFKLPLRSQLHYLLMLLFYPITALTWLLGIVCSLLYLLTGATSIDVAWNQFLSFYLMSTVLQLGLYFWSGRYNVSPHEPLGTYSIPSTLLTTLTQPVYLSAMVGILLGKKPHFVVTAKGKQRNPDSLHTFHLHFKWAAVLLAGLAYGMTHGHHQPALLVWVGIQLATCLLAPVLGMAGVLQDRWPRMLRRISPRKRLVLAGENHAA